MNQFVSKASIYKPSQIGISHVNSPETETDKSVVLSLLLLLSFAGEETLLLGSTVFGSYKVALKVSTAFEQTEVVVSLTVKACSVDSCIQEIDVIRNIRLQQHQDLEDDTHIRHKRGIFSRGKYFAF